MVTLTIDGAEVKVAEGRTILQALDDLGLLMNGVDVPHYCWHPKLSIDGSCRLCQVEIEGQPKLQIACNTVVAEGMVVRTTTERVKNARAGVMELLLVNHPLDCPICDQAGECKLQDYAFEYGVSHARTREPRRALKKRVDLGPTITLDQERCILCRRCVRFTREISKTDEIAVLARGDRSVIETLPGVPLDNDYSMNVADICPVGALTTKDFRFKIRVWFLEERPSVCAGCANGCNLYAGVANNRVYRYVPRRNDAVNATWICDEGRLSYKRIAAPDRVREASVRGASGLASTPVASAITAAAARLRAVTASGAGVVAAIASAHATNEDLFVLRRFCDALGTDTRGLAVPRGRADDFLIKAEKAANAAGARALGFQDIAGVAERIRGGGVRALVALGHDALADLGGEAALAALDCVILLDTHHSPLERVATVVFPTRVAAEKTGTLTNHAGRVQRILPAVEPAFAAQSEGEVLWRIGQALGLSGFPAGERYDVAAVSKALSQALPAFAGIDLDSVGGEGLPLAKGAA
jgi:NADH-quinone oxidoreductase subunit G